MRRWRASQTKRQQENSNATEETTGIEGVGGIELALDGFHEAQGIARSAPGVERWERGGTVKKDERASHSFDVGPQSGECAMQIVWTAFEPEPAEARRVHQGFPANLRRVGAPTEEFDSAPEVGGKSTGFGDGGLFRVGKRPKILPCAPNFG